MTLNNQVLHHFMDSGTRLLPISSVYKVESLIKNQPHDDEIKGVKVWLIDNCLILESRVGEYYTTNNSDLTFTSKCPVSIVNGRFTKLI